jgi:hypothetical protein
MPFGKSRPGKTLLKQTLLGLIVSQRDRSQSGGSCLGAPTQFEQEFRVDRVEQMVSLQITPERLAYQCISDEKIRRAI